MDGSSLNFSPQNKTAMPILVGLGLLVFLSIFGRLPARADSTQDWEKILAGARKEGRLAVFLYQRGNIEAAVKAFQKNYPEIQVITGATSAAETGPRIMAERRSEKYLWDICICGPTTPFSVFYAAKALDPIQPALILPEILDESKWWGGKHHYMDPEGKFIFVFIGTVEMPNLYYNKNLVKGDELKSYWDLVQPKWKGKIIALDPSAPGRQRVGARILYYNPDLGAKFLRRFFTEIDVVLTRDERQSLDWLASGKFALCLFCGGIEEARPQGLAVEEFKTIGWKDAPAIYSGSNGTLALMNRAPHPNAAKVFVNS